VNKYDSPAFTFLSALIALINYTVSWNKSRHNLSQCKRDWPAVNLVPNMKPLRMNAFLFRFVAIFFLLSHVKELHANDSVYVFKEANIKLNIPNSHWHLQPRQEQNGLIIYVFKRDRVIDSANRNIIPNAAVIIENINPKTDVVTYSVNKRANAFFEVTQMFIHDDGIIDFVNAVGYKGTYTDDNPINHTVYVVHAINKDKGLQFIFDTTTDTLPIIESEFLQMLKSIRK
jgi:hypothetical protein